MGHMHGTDDDIDDTWNAPVVSWLARSTISEDNIIEVARAMPLSTTSTHQKSYVPKISVSIYYHGHY